MGARGADVGGRVGVVDASDGRAAVVVREGVVVTAPAPLGGGGEGGRGEEAELEEAGAAGSVLAFLLLLVSFSVGQNPGARRGHGSSISARFGWG